ncbi:MAG: hypothetical protein Q9161_001846 [Pseudevernia consocians]
MIPDFLTDTYKYYKSNTTEALTWLGTTEKARNETIAVFQQAPKQPRLKGKARKSAKETAPATASEKYILALADIVPLARRIVRYDQHSLQVPPRIIRILRKAITARKQCSAWFLKQVDNDLVTNVSNEGHAYFTAILEEVLSLLQPFCRRDPSSTSATNDPGNLKYETHRDSWENTFRSLEIEDPDIEADAGVEESPQPSGKEDTPTNRPSVVPKIVYEVETDKEDVRFAVFCLFRDLDVLRQHLHNTWRKYACYETSLIEASAVTNTAVEFVRRIEQNFLATYTQFSDWEAVMQNLFPEAMTYKEDFYLQYSTSVDRQSLRSFYFLPFQLLVAYRDSGDDGKLPFLVDNYDPRLDHFGQTEQEQWRREQILLMEVFGEFEALVVNDRVITEDKLTQGLRDVLHDKMIFLWVVFALQSFVDIRNTLGKPQTPPPDHHPCVSFGRQLTFETGEKVDRGLGELQDTGTQVKNFFQWYCHHSPELKENRVPHQDKTLAWLAVNIDKWVLNDILEDLKARTWRNGHSNANSGRPFLLLAQHPWLCGLLKCAIRMEIQAEGFRQLDLQGLVIATTQLYHAVQHGGRVSLPWPDMDKLARFHSKSPFFGSIEKTPAIAYQRLLVSHGASVVMFAPNRHNNQNVRAKAGEPIIYKQSPLIFALYKRFCSVGVEGFIVVDDLEKLLSERMLKRTRRKSASNNFALGDGFSPVQLLAELENAIAEEEEALCFDYFDLHQQCCQVLRSIERLVHHDFRNWDTHKGKTDNEVLHLIPQFILESFTVKGSMLSRQGGHMLQQAAETLQVFLEQQEAQANEAYKGMISKEEEEEHLPELSPATLWGILDRVPTEDGESVVRHATRNGKCIHVGVCDLLYPEADI